MIRRSRSGAQALVWFTLMLPVFVSIAGLAIDGGVLLTSRRQLQSVADGAARAGATRLDVQRLRDTAGGDIELDTAAADATARAYLDARLAREVTWQAPPDLDVEVNARGVYVNVQGRVPTAFLRIAHVDSVPVGASAFADVQFGIRTGDGG